LVWMVGCQVRLAIAGIQSGCAGENCRWEI
jgi:hypothetical protein